MWDEERGRYRYAPGFELVDDEVGERYLPPGEFAGRYQEFRIAPPERGLRQVIEIRGGDSEPWREADPRERDQAQAVVRWRLAHAVPEDRARTVLELILHRYGDMLLPLTYEVDGVTEVLDPQLGSEDRPRLIADYRREGHWAVSWEAGPFEWAYRASGGGVDEETAAALHHEFGVSRGDAGRRCTEQPLRAPEGTLLEPVNTYTLGIYPE